MSRPVIVTCAITGSIHTPSQSPYLPLTPAQIIEESVAAAEAGAAVLHLHARNPVDGSPTADPEVFMQFLPQIRARCNAIINITTGGGPGMSLEERLVAPERVSPEMTSLNLGTMNFAGFMALEKLPKLQHKWEEDYRKIARTHVFRNTFEDIDTVMVRLGEGHGVRFEFECYDVGQLYNPGHCAGEAPLRSAPVHPVRAGHSGGHRGRSRPPAAHGTHGAAHVRQ